MGPAGPVVGVRVVGGGVGVLNGLRWIWVQRDEYQTAHFAAVIARLDPKSGLPDFGTYQNDRNRKHPISIGDPVKHRPWLLDCPVNPRIKSGEGNDTGRVNLEHVPMWSNPPSPVMPALVAGIHVFFC